MNLIYIPFLSIYFASIKTIPIFFLPLFWGEVWGSRILLASSQRTHILELLQFSMFLRDYMLFCFLENLLFFFYSYPYLKKIQLMQKRYQHALFYLKRKKDNLRTTYSFLISVMKACNPSFLLRVFFFFLSLTCMQQIFSYLVICQYSVNLLLCVCHHFCQFQRD